MQGPGNVTFLNEGVTELLTERSLGRPSEEGVKYGRNVEVARALEGLVGRGVLEAAYFDGNVAGLVDAIDAKLGARTAERLFELMRLAGRTGDPDLVDVMQTIIAGGGAGAGRSTPDLATPVTGPAGGDAGTVKQSPPDPSTVRDPQQLRPAAEGTVVDEVATDTVTKVTAGLAPQTNGPTAITMPGGSLTLVGEGGSTSAGFLVRDGNGKQYLFKPTEGSAVSQQGADRGIEAGSLARRAAAAAQLANTVGVETPKVWLVELQEGGPLQGHGSLQEWVPDARTMLEIGASGSAGRAALEANPAYQRQRADLDALDYLTNNLDRTTRNLLVSGEGPGLKLTAIDQDQTFAPLTEDQAGPRWASEGNDPLRYQAAGRANALPDPAHVSAEVRARILALAADPDGAAASLRPYLSPRELALFQQRLATLAQHLGGQTPGS
jgi:hypothetical protein